MVYNQLVILTNYKNSMWIGELTPDSRICLNYGNMSVVGQS